MFIGGIAAGAIAIAISLLLRLFAGGPFIPEIASQTLFSLTPGAIESQAVGTFGPLAKYSAFIGAIVANLVLYGIIAMFLGRLYKMFSWKGYARYAILSSVISFIILIGITVLLLALTEGQEQSISISFLASFLLLPHIAFGFTLHSFFYKRSVAIEQPSLPSTTTTTKDREVSDRKIEPEKIDQRKRLFLRAGVAGAAAIPIIYFGLESLLSPRRALMQSTSLLLSQFQQKIKNNYKPKGFENPRLAPLLESEITSTDQFYRIDKNALVPQLNAQGWKLNVKGRVDKPLEINYQQLRSMPSVEQFATLECVSNKIGGDLISTAVWKGVHLKDILGMSNLHPSAKYLVFRCADGYDVGIPLERGLLEGTILAYDMNGAPLPEEHGYPVRAVVPGLYGMMNPKWITEIELVDRVYEGYWQRKGWANNAKYNTHSAIVIPGNSAVRKRFRNLAASDIATGTMIPFGGMAFAGDRGILKVEVSTNGGITWKDTQLKEPLSRYTWVLWATELGLANKDNYKIVVRATDKTGRVQTAEIKDPFPNGATGYYILSI